MSQPSAVGEGSAVRGMMVYSSAARLGEMQCVRMRAGRRGGELEDAFIIKVRAARLVWRGVRCAEV